MKNQKSKNEELLKEQLEYSYKEDQKAFSLRFQQLLMQELKPVVQNLVDYIRFLETAEVGKGKTEADRLLMVGDINGPMHEILNECIQDLTSHYEVNLDPNKYLNDKN